MAKSLADRLRFELSQVREELRESVLSIPPEDIDWAPREGMRTYRGLLIEIGATEILSTVFLTGAERVKWEEAEARVTGRTAEELMATLDGIRAVLLAELEKGDDYLRGLMPVKGGLAKYLGGEELEREEMIRWIARHEYYHLGQLVTHRWMQGFNPYEE